MKGSLQRRTDSGGYLLVGLFILAFALGVYYLTVDKSPSLALLMGACAVLAALGLLFGIRR